MIYCTHAKIFALIRAVLILNKLATKDLNLIASTKEWVKYFTRVLSQFQFLYVFFSNRIEAVQP